MQVGQGNPTTEENDEWMDVQLSIYFPPRNSSQIVQCGGDVATVSAPTRTNKRKLSSRKSRRYEEQKNKHARISSTCEYGQPLS